MLQFKCLKCGGCCKNLFRENPSGLNGLSVFSDELYLFPKKKLAPARGVGESPNDEYFVVTHYQLRVRNCPFLEGNSCTIYERRPLACRCYPFTPGLLSEGGLRLEYDPDCRGMLELQAKNPSDFALYQISAPDELRLNRLLLKKLFEKESQATGHKIWYYDLRTNKWITGVSLRKKVAK